MVCSIKLKVFLKGVKMEFIKESAKAIVAFVVTTACVWAAKKGFVVDVDTQTALVSALYGIVVGLSVWITKNKINK